MGDKSFNVTLAATATLTTYLASKKRVAMARLMRKELKVERYGLDLEFLHKHPSFEWSL